MKRKRRKASPGPDAVGSAVGSRVLHEIVADGSRVLHEIVADVTGGGRKHLCRLRDVRKPSVREARRGYVESASKEREPPICPNFARSARCGQTHPSMGRQMAWQLRSGSCPSSRRGVEWQGRRERPQGEQFRERGRALLQPLGAGSECIDERAILCAKLHRCSLVRRMNKGSRAAIGRGRPRMWILLENRSHTHGRASLGQIHRLGLLFDVLHHPPTFGLMLTPGQVLQARQLGQLDVVCSGELPGQHSLAPLPGFVLGSAVEPGSAQQFSPAKGSDAICARP